MTETSNRIEELEEENKELKEKLDVQEVVRCKDCKYLLSDLSAREHHLCMRSFYPVAVTFDDFCSYGARMDGDTE